MTKDEFVTDGSIQGCLIGPDHGIDAVTLGLQEFGLRLADGVRVFFGQDCRHSTGDMGQCDRRPNEMTFLCHDSYPFYTTVV